MSQKVPTTLPLATADYNFVNESLTREQTTRAIQFLEQEVFNLKRMHNFHLNIVNSKGYSFFMETIFQIKKRGFNITEIPIIFEVRLKGESKIPKIELLRTLKNVFMLKFLS